MPARSPCGCGDHSTGARVAIASDLGTLRAIRPADLLEKPLAGSRARKRSVELHGYQVATVLARLEIPMLVDRPARWARRRGRPTAIRALLAAQPRARTAGWAAGRRHLHPAALTASRQRGGLAPDRGQRLHRRCADRPVTLHCPDGWSAAPAELPFTLDSGAHQEADIVLAVRRTCNPAGIRSGRNCASSGCRPGAWRQVVEDVCIVEVGGRDEDELVYLVDGPCDIELAAGASARLTVTVGTHARADVSLEANLISPWGTWSGLVRPRWAPSCPPAAPSNLASA